MTQRSASVISLYAEAEAAFGGTRELRLRRPGTAVDQLVGERIRRRRIELGFEQAKVAAALDVPSSKFNSFESGAERIGASRLQKLAQLLDVSPMYFFKDDRLIGGASDDSPAVGAALDSLISIEVLSLVKTDPGAAWRLFQESLARGASIAQNKQKSSDDLTIERGDARSKISRDISTKQFFEQHFRAPVEKFYPVSRLFSLFVSADSIVVESSGQFFASGEALISVPTKTRKGAKVEASLSLPVHISGKWRSESLTVEKAELAPIESHFPPDLALRLRAPPARRRSPAAAQ